ncbi:MAG: hypothetical protein ACI9YU_001848 [Flavobacteriales bacterium]|jgi:hypothetical protein
MKQAFYFTALLLLSVLSATASRVQLHFTTSPSNARISVNGEYLGTGSTTFVLAQAGGKVHVMVELEGYVTYNKFYHYNYKYGGYNTTVERYNKGSNSYRITLHRDPNYIDPNVISTRYDSINRYYLCEVKDGINAEIGWKTLKSVIRDHFEDISFTNVQQGDIRTPWDPSQVGQQKIRTRLIVRTENEDPLIYKFKLQSEYCNDLNAYEYDDYRFQPWNRVLNKYRGLLGAMFKQVGKP